MNVLLRQVKVCDPQSEFHNKTVDVSIENGIITDIAASLDTNADEIIEGENICVAPGFVDVFADYCEPGYEHKETIRSGLDAAAAGGYTQVLLAPNTQPTLSSKSAIEYVLQRAKGHAVQLLPLGAISQNIEGKELAEMLDMRAYGAVAFTDGWKPVQQSALMMKALEYVKAFNGIVIQIPVDSALSKGGLMHEGPNSTMLGMAGIPSIAETLMLHRDIELLRYTKSRLHVTGISAAASVDMVRKAKEEGLDITCSVTPYHLALNDDALKTYSSMYKVMPPLRSEEDRQALIAGLADGTIDCVASHHRPQDWDAKEKEFEYASDGMNLQENTFQVAYEAVKGVVSLERLVDAFSARPRAIFGLEAGSIAKDAKAELTLFSLSASEATKRKSLSTNNPFAANSFSTSIVRTVNNELHKNRS